jgi:hypothetical protein
MPPIIRCDQMVVGTVFRFGGWLLNCLTGKFLPSDDRHDVGCWARARGTDPLYSRRGGGLAKAVRHMEQLQVRRLPVINKSRRMVGILSLGDVSNSAPGDLLSECVKSVSAHHH